MKKTIVLLMILAVSINLTQAQWQKTNGPSGSFIYCIAVDGNNIYVGASGGGVYLSVDNGENWQLICSGLISNSIDAIAVEETNIFVGGSEGVFYSSDYGSTWTSVSSGVNGAVRTIVLEGANVFVGTYYGVYFSDNYGSTWTSVNNGLTSTNIFMLEVCDGKIFASTEDGLFSTIDDGANWISANSGLSNCSVQAIVKKENLLYAATSDGVFVSHNNGEDWIYNGLDGYMVYSAAATEVSIFAGTKHCGLYRSDDNGQTWNSQNIGVSDDWVTCLEVANSNVFMGANPTGMLRSTDNGQSWINKNSGISGRVVQTLTLNGNRIFAGVGQVGLSFTDDGGETWVICNNGLPNEFNVSALIASGGNIIVGGSEGVFISNDNGANWLSTNRTTTTSTFTKLGTRLFAGGNGVHYSDDNGFTWLPTSFANGVNTLEAKDNTVYVGSTEDVGLYKSIDNGVSWTNTNLGYYHVNDIAFCSEKIYVIVGGAGPFVSTDNGETWDEVTDISGVSSIEAIDNTILASTNGGMMVSVDCGDSWYPWDEGLNVPFVLDFAITETDVYIGTWYSGVWKRPLSEIGIPDELQIKNNVEIFPNPARDYLKIKNVKYIEEAKASIYSLQGQKLYEQIIVNERINVKNLKSGLYLFKIEMDGGEQVCKFMKE